MEVISDVSAPFISGGEPLMTLWPMGPCRLIDRWFGGWVDVTDARRPQQLAANYKIGIAAIAFSQPLPIEAATQPFSDPTAEHPLGKTKPQVEARIRADKPPPGIRVRDVTNPLEGRILGEFRVGQAAFALMTVAAVALPETRDRGFDGSS